MASLKSLVSRNWKGLKVVGLQPALQIGQVSLDADPVNVLKEKLGKSITPYEGLKQVVVVHYSYLQDLALARENNDSFQSLNQALSDFCEDFNNGKTDCTQVFALASLNSSKHKTVSEMLDDNKESPFIRGYTLDCDNCDYEMMKSMIVLHDFFNSPVSVINVPRTLLLTCNPDRGQNFAAIADAVRHISDNKLMPDVNIIIPSEVIPILKYPKNYIKDNIYVTCDLSDSHYFKYLLETIGDNNVILTHNDLQSEPELSCRVSQLTLNKILGGNASQIFQLENSTVSNSNLSCQHKINMANITVLDQLHSVHFLASQLRDKNTPQKKFQQIADRLMAILAEEALAMVPSVRPCEVTTPTGNIQGLVDDSDRKLCVVSIVRSGDILQEAVRRVDPGISVGKILIQRDESTPEKKPSLYYTKLPKDISDRYVLLVDPMLATAGSAISAVDTLVSNGVKSSDIMFVNLFSVEEGLAKLQAKYPDIKIVTLFIDEFLNEEKYIVPGVGDFGDRYYGTE